jgi:phage tail-like protein
LTLQVRHELPNVHILDIARESGSSIFVLVKRNEKFECLRISTSDHEIRTISFDGISDPTAFAFLRWSRRFVVLADERHPRLYRFSEDGGRAVFSQPIAAIQPDFKVDALGSDSNEIIILAGNSKDPSAPGAKVVILDSDGNRLGQVLLKAPATGIAATRQNLIVTNERGLLRFAVTDVVPNNTPEVQCILLTPMLQSIDPEDSSPWLRIEASASLPEGTTLELAYAATDDLEVRERLRVITEDIRLLSSQRIQNLLGDPDLQWTNTIFQGNDREQNKSTPPFSAPLFGAGNRHLWVSVKLTASRGAKLPALKQLSVLYPGRSLVENLPTPYRRAAEQPGDFLRALVGVLEATTQNLDARIAALGTHIHPNAATGEWLDYIANWLSLPWDDALSDQQKQSILLSAAEIARGRGTRAGLETLLECLLPGSPRRFRVTDASADFGYAVVGGNQCAGSALPAMLGGFTRWHAELNVTTVLGYTRLPCPAQSNNDVWKPAAKIRIDVAGGYKEREAMEPWLLNMITDMIPLTVSVDLSWVSSQALRTDRLDDTLVLKAPPSPHLGTDAITGLSRLPEPRRTQLTRSEPAIGAPLR